MEKDRVYTGVVCWFSKGYGFISFEVDGKPQKDMFMHFSDIKMEGFKQVRKDDIVQFQIGTNNRGEPKAIEIVVIRK